MQRSHTRLAYRMMCECSALAISSTMIWSLSALVALQRLGYLCVSLSVKEDEVVLLDCAAIPRSSSSFY
eukprot:scaffold67260_cov53-Attheya_sp.AAC.5